MNDIPYVLRLNAYGYDQRAIIYRRLLADYHKLITIAEKT